MHKSFSIETYYGPIADQILEKAKDIRLLVCDVDGVMSNGLIYVNNYGEEFKTFNIRDNYGIQRLLDSNIEMAIITGRYTNFLKTYCLTIGIKYLYQGQKEKILALNELLNKLKLTTEQVAYLGDDLIDSPVMEQVGLSIAVADAHPTIKSISDYITRASGGFGAVREVCDLLLCSRVD
ncbi:3-deoxy-manno-octulosonate-8-phosphatase KdsC [Sodalis sp. CWE]|uniref:3-deoxy-manno-octulosonate-8-phosphatase KdsC n=1 Tax=Sodalis sp. CWE TaxID=2803816 RepID=UPI001C7CCBFC|nr:3-deoxy-manno-octulosonate-8-phosphatase KdsC [Sodalis sp. CWE]MBX4180845.1 3-deoxy-manno-octulosonate-8-phosphatase KdsC [Sodalis sp. CWE]